MKKHESKSNKKYWIVGKWEEWVENSERKRKPVFVNPPEKTGYIELNEKSGHATFAINAEEHKFYFKLNKKGIKNLSVQEVLAGAPWSVYFPEYSSYSELVFDAKNSEVVGTISPGLQDWYELADFPTSVDEKISDDEKIKSHKIYARLNQNGKLEYKVRYPETQVNHGFITHDEVSDFFQKRQDEAPSPSDPNYVKKSFKAISAITAQRNHTQPSHVLERNCEFNEDKTDYYSLAGSMVYSHTNCEDDLHRENIIVIHKDGKDYYYRIDFDMSYQSLTEKPVAAFMGIKENVRSNPRQQLVDVKITPESFKTFPLGIHEPLHFWPGVTRPLVGGKKLRHTISSYFGWRASDKGWDEAQNSDKNLTRQFTDLAYHPEFVKWKIYHYARYITTPTSIIEKEMESRIAKIRQNKEDKVSEIAGLQKKRDQLAESKSADPDLKKIDNQIAQAKTDLETHYNDEEAANHIQKRLLSEDSDRRQKFYAQLTKIPEFARGVVKYKDEFLKRLEADNNAYKTRYGSEQRDIDEDLRRHANRFEKLYDDCVNTLNKKPAALNVSIMKQDIFNEIEFKEKISNETNLREIAKIINVKRSEIYQSGLFNQSEKDHFEKISRERSTEISLKNLTEKVKNAETLPEIAEIIRKAKHDLNEEPKALAQIEKLAQTQKEVLQSKAANELQKHSKVIDFLKYAGGAVAILLLARVMLPEAAFHAVRILGVDVFRNLYAHAGLWAGSVGVLSASTALGVSFFSRQRQANVPLKELKEVFFKVLEICQACGEKLPLENHPADILDILIKKIQYKQCVSTTEQLKEEFGLAKEDDSVLINQLKELSKALSTQDARALQKVENAESNNINGLQA